MGHREWEANQSLLHRFNNVKHMRLTPRTERESPVFQRFDSTDGYGDIVVAVTAVGAFAVIVVMAVAGVL
jgi:hypothetical protein